MTRLEPADLFDTSDADAARDLAASHEEREQYLQEQLARALAQRGRMFALGYQTAVEEFAELGYDLPVPLFAEDR